MATIGDRSRTIHHFDDEPEMIDWIPASLFDYCLASSGEELLGDWRDNYGSRSGEHDVIEFVMDLQSRVSLRYRIYPRPEGLLRALPVSEDDVIIVDLGLALPGGALVPAGLDLLRAVSRSCRREALFVLTAFPHLLRECSPELVDPGNVMLKPADAVQLVMALTSALRLI